MNKKKKYNCYEIVINLVLSRIIQLKSEGNSHIAKPKRGELPLTQKVIDTALTKNS